MIAVLGGLGAALAFAVTTLCAARSAPLRNAAYVTRSPATFPQAATASQPIAPRSSPCGIPLNAAVGAATSRPTIITHARTDHGPSNLPVLLAVAGACLFGPSLYAVGRVGAVLPIFRAVLPARLVGVVAVAVPLATMSRLKLPGVAWPFLVAGGLGEVVGLASYEIAARHSLAKRCALLAVRRHRRGDRLLAVHERLRRVQIGGIVLIVVGVGVLSAIQN